MSPGPSGKKGKNPQKKSFMEQYRDFVKKEQHARNASRKDETAKKNEREDKVKDLTVQEPEEESAPEIEEVPRKKTREQKQREHLIRIEQTLVACALGIITGIISFLVITPSQILGLQNYTLLALLIMIAGIVVQRHIFMLLRLDSDKMGFKNWFYQGFMTFAFWFITWTLLLTKGA